MTIEKPFYQAPSGKNNLEAKLNPGAFDFYMRKYYNYLHSPGDTSLSFEDFVKLFAKNTRVKIKKINLDDAYDEAKYNTKAVYGLESLNILVGDYTSDRKQLQKLSNVKLTTVREFLQTSRLS